MSKNQRNKQKGIAEGVSESGKILNRLFTINPLYSAILAFFLTPLFINNESGIDLAVFLSPLFLTWMKNKYIRNYLMIGPLFLLFGVFAFVFYALILFKLKYYEFKVFSILLCVSGVVVPFIGQPLATTVQEYDWNTLNEKNFIILFFTLLAYGLINVIVIGLHGIKAFVFKQEFKSPFSQSTPKVSKEPNKESIAKQTKGLVVNAKEIEQKAKPLIKEVKEPRIKVEKIDPNTASFKKGKVVSFEDYIRKERKSNS